MLPSSPLPLSHCPDLSPSSAKKNTQKTQFSPHSPIFRINLSDPSRPHFEDERKSRVTVCSHCCGSSEITPLVQHSRMKLPFKRSIEIKFYIHYQCYFSYHFHSPKISAALRFHRHIFFGRYEQFLSLRLRHGLDLVEVGYHHWDGGLPPCVLQLEGWGI